MDSSLQSDPFEFTPRNQHTQAYSTSRVATCLQTQVPSLASNNQEISNVGREVPPRTSTPIVNMIASNAPVKTESMTSPSVWTTQESHASGSRPATLNEGFSDCVGEGYATLPSCDSTPMPQSQTSVETMSRPMSMHQELYPVPPTNVGSSESLHKVGYDPGPLTRGLDPWAWKKPFEDNVGFQSLDSDLSIGQAYMLDEAIPVMDLRLSNPSVEGECLKIEDGCLNFRRMSGSSFSMSTNGALSEMTSLEDFSTGLSEEPSFSSEYPPPSNRNSLMSSTQLSPVASPRMTPLGRSELVRTQSRGRGTSPSPRPGVRSAPYSVDGSRIKRWSTESSGSMPSRRHSPFIHQSGQDPFGSRLTSRHSSPTIPSTQLPLNFANIQAVQQNPYFPSSNAALLRHSMLLPSQLPSQLSSSGFSHDPRLQPHSHHSDAPPPLFSHGLFRMLQSNAGPQSLYSHYTDLPDPPDLYASLHEEQVPPPPEDMNPSDPELVPHEQELRFEGDLYTPKWVRGHRNKRQGWCGICKPGRWLVLKNSAFWYDKSFTHGISAATGSPFQEPQDARRMDGNPDVWEGLCGSCNEWIALVSNKKKGTTWFRHAYKVGESFPK